MKKKYYNMTNSLTVKGTISREWTVVGRMSAIEHTSYTLTRKLYRMDSAQKDDILRYAVENSLTILETAEGVVLLETPDSALDDLDQ